MCDPHTRQPTPRRTALQLLQATELLHAIPVGTGQLSRQAIALPFRLGADDLIESKATSDFFNVEIEAGAEQDQYVAVLPMLLYRSQPVLSETLSHQPIEKHWGPTVQFLAGRSTEDGMKKVLF